MNDWKKRAVSWAVAALLIWIGVKAYAGFSNPWKLTTPASISPIGAFLPPAAPGCGPACKAEGQ